MQARTADHDNHIDSHLSLAQATRLIPGRPHVATLWRWATKGIRRGEHVIRLKTVIVGGRRYTTPAWCDALVAGCSADIPADPRDVAADAQRRSTEAGKALEALGA